MLKVALEKANPNDTKNYAFNNRYENRLDYLDNFCLADFASSYISKKVVDNSWIWGPKSLYFASFSSLWKCIL